MNRIDTDIAVVIVEIEDKEYPVAEKTTEVAEKLLEAQAKHMGKPEYTLWMAELEILLGKAAVKELFNSGKKENLDRMQRIHAGVIQAFECNSAKVTEEKAERQMEMMEPMNEFLRQLASVLKADQKKTIRRT